MPETDQPGTAQPDALAIMRSRRYVGLLVLAAVLGVPISAAAYWFLRLITLVTDWSYTDLPDHLGFDGQPTWWPLVPLTAAGVIVGLTIRHLPGRGGEVPVDGFSPGGVAPPAALPGIALAAVASIGLGAVVGPEAPLIALGGGLAHLVATRGRRDQPAQAAMLIGATGSFAAVAALLGSPLTGAVLLLEASGLGGTTATAVLLPGLLASGIGALIFVGFDSLTGYGTYSLTVPDLGPVSAVTGADLAWAVAIGLVAAPICWMLRGAARALLPHVSRRLVLLTTAAGVLTALLAILYAEVTGKSTADVLFSGEAALPALVHQSASYSVGALLMLFACKGLAYVLGLSSFRGGPTFPAILLGAAGGLALSHAPGLDLVPAVGMGMGAMAVGILRLPITSVLIATLVLGSGGLTVMPVVIVAVVVSFVVSERLLPAPVASPPTPTASPRE